MFKTDDIVVCIDNTEGGALIYSSLTYGKKYDVTKYFKSHEDKQCLILIRDDRNMVMWYLANRFILLSELRRNKILKLMK